MGAAPLPARRVRGALESGPLLVAREEATRPFRELRMTAALHAAGLPVPAPVAARYVRAGLPSVPDFLHRAHCGVRTLSAALAEWPAAVWTTVGQCVRRLHAAGAWHADLNAHNILVALPPADAAAGSAPLVHVIDWDRGQLHAQPLAARAARGNLLRLQRSLQKLALEAGWRSATPLPRGRNSRRVMVRRREPEGAAFGMSRPQGAAEPRARFARSGPVRPVTGGSACSSQQVLFGGASYLLFDGAVITQDVGRGIRRREVG
jgi:hypothetical protein